MSTRWAGSPARPTPMHNAAATSTARQMAAPDGRGQLQHGHAGRLLRHRWRGCSTNAPTVPATKGIMLVFDDFLIGLEQFGQRIQPLMKSRQHKLKAVA